MCIDWNISRMERPIVVICGAFGSLNGRGLDYMNTFCFAMVVISCVPMPRFIVCVFGSKNQWAKIDWAPLMWVSIVGILSFTHLSRDSCEYYDHNYRIWQNHASACRMPIGKIGFKDAWTTPCWNGIPWKLVVAWILNCSSYVSSAHREAKDNQYEIPALCSMQCDMRATIMHVDGRIEGSKESQVFLIAHLHLVIVCLQGSYLNVFATNWYYSEGLHPHV